MEQHAKTKPSIDIQITRDGELKISNLNSTEELSKDQFIIVQELIDESKLRAKAYSQIRAIASKDACLQGAIAAFVFLTTLILIGFLIGRAVQKSISSPSPLPTLQKIN